MLAKDLQVGDSFIRKTKPKDDTFTLFAVKSIACLKGKIHIATFCSTIFAFEKDDEIITNDFVVMTVGFSEMLRIVGPYAHRHDACAYAKKERNAIVIECVNPNN